MKVLLVRPPAPNILSFTKVLDNEPLELEYLHTALQARGIEDAIYDGLIRHDFESALRQEKPQVIAVTGYITQRDLMLRYCETAKGYDPSIATVVGGVHAQLNYGDFYVDSVDYVYRSECVWDFARLVEIIGDRDVDGGLSRINGGLPGINGGLSRINGLCYRINEAFHENELRPIDVDNLPIPERSHFYANREHYRYLDLTGVASVKTALSCPYDCNFCYCTLLGGGVYRARSLDLVIEELVALDAQNIQIVDDDFLVDRIRVLQFVDMVKARGIRKTYVCYARADFVCEYPDIVQALADIGFKYFLVGLEAVTDDELASMNKKTSVDMNARCVDIIHEAGAHCVALMIAPIDADRKYFKALYEWVKKTGLRYVTTSIFTPIPGTPLYEAYRDRITSQDTTDWDFLHLVMEPEKLSRRQFYGEFRKLFLRLYRIAAKTGIYSFMDIKYYRKLLMDYLDRKRRGL